ncbi:MAG: CocE/NonD family hydrolase, partial [Anaerolineales bacterium]
MTPYIADSYHPTAWYFARHGYAFLLVDNRGRGNSGGEFEPYVHDEKDAYDVIQWLAVQPWCDGQVAMWGGSYGGFNQWMAAKSFPPQLKTIAPVAAAHAGVDFPILNNIYYAYEMQWQTLVSGRTGNNKLFEEWDFWIDKFRQLYLEQRPFTELDQVVGNPSPTFQSWIQHPEQDEHWDQMALARDEYDRLDIPILTITGHYDDDQPGAMHYYQQHMQSQSPARVQHYLVIGPWDHAGTRKPDREFGGLEFSDACLLDMNELHRQWYDWRLKYGPKPEFLKKLVAYYVMGAEQWKYADSLEETSNSKLRLYLSSYAGMANDVFYSGLLTETMPESGKPDTYTYDPLDTRPAELESEHIEDYLIDQRYHLNLFGNGLVYHSLPFEQEIEITGYARLIAWISMDVPDTDFQLTLSEILSDGRHIELAYDLQRARYRNSLRQAELVTPGEIVRYEFSFLNFFSRRISRGSRLRLLIRSPNTIYLQKNYNSGGLVSYESAADARTAHIMLYHDAEHPSCLELPVFR